MNRTLWVVQALVAVVFLVAGASKLAMPAEVLAASSPLPVLFVRFIGACEIFGAIGLIVPAVTRIRPMLTPIAAICLAIIMVGATVSTLLVGMGAAALMPFILGVAVVFIAYGRLNLAPIAEKTSAIPTLAKQA